MQKSLSQKRTGDEKMPPHIVVQWIVLVCQKDLLSVCLSDHFLPFLILTVSLIFENSYPGRLNNFGDPRVRKKGE